MRLALVLLCCLALLFPAPAVAGTDPETVALLTLVNQDRALHGAPALVVIPALQNAADYWSDQQVAHCPTPVIGDVGTRLRLFGYPSGAVQTAENLACGATAAEIFAGWQANPSQQTNLRNAIFHAAGLSRTCVGTVCVWVLDLGALVTQNTTPVPTNTPSSGTVLTPRPSTATATALSSPTTSLIGDLNNDGVVDIYDLSLLAANFGRHR